MRYQHIEYLTKWSRFISKLEYEAAENGVHVVEMD